MKAKQKFLLGTAVKITTMLDIANPTSVSIKVADSADVVKQAYTIMTKDTDTVYSYIYQSNSNDNEGDYVITISVVSGAYTAISQEYVEFILQA